MKVCKRIFAAALAIAMTTSMMFSTVFAAGTTNFSEAEVDKSDIVVLYTNDVHGGISNNESMSGSSKSLGYAGLAAVKEEASNTAGAVTLVDLGDAIQGSVVDTMSNGLDSMTLMKEVGYDICIPGNHEFDYGVDEFIELATSSEWEDLNYICANFTDMQGNPVLGKGYDVLEYNIDGKSVKVAYVGLDTPECIAKGTPADFQDENGEYKYTFQADTVEQFYASVQNTVDEARTDADYVVVLGHIGDQGVVEGWSSYDIIANTTGIDVFLDGHAHSTIAGATVLNKDGENVLLSSTGTKLEKIGCLKLSVEADGSIVANTTLIDTLTDKQLQSQAYKQMAQKVKDIEDKYAYLVEVVATSDFDLRINDPYTPSFRLVRRQDCNMADMLTDAYLWYSEYDSRFEKADLSFMNGGSIRADISAGNITYTNVLTVFPWYTHVTEIKATGQQILDCLEMGARLETDECGGFMTGGNLSYTVNMNKESKVVTDAAGMFVKVDGTYQAGDYRVENVKIGGEDLDINKTYTLVINNYYYQEDGDGMTMFKNCESVVDYNDNVIDVDVIIAFLKEACNGKVPQKYSNPYGDGRISMVSSAAISKAEADQTLFAALANGVKGATEKSTQYIHYSIDKGLFNSNGKYIVEVPYEALPEEFLSNKANTTYYCALNDGSVVECTKQADGLRMEVSQTEGVIAIGYGIVTDSPNTFDNSQITAVFMVVATAAVTAVMLKSKKEDMGV